MNRRRFFQSLSAAVLGAAISLKIPEILIPQIPDVEVDYEFGWTGSGYYDSNVIKGRILAQINLEILTPRNNRTIYIEDC
jgi:hypothetical protein